MFEPVSLLSSGVTQLPLSPLLVLVKEILGHLPWAMCSAFGLPELLGSLFYLVAAVKLLSGGVSPPPKAKIWAEFSHH